MKAKSFHLADHGLWDEVRRTIAPLKRPVAKSVPSTASASPQSVIQPGSRASLRLHRPETPPPLAAFDRRTAQKLSRGQLEPEARLDLHGDGLEAARMKLFHFLELQRRSGRRLVLVITGKGASPFGRHTLHSREFYHAPEREGRLRREVPLWLHEEPFRDHVAGFQPAHPRHGGGGAFYLRLRKLHDGR